MISNQVLPLISPNPSPVFPCFSTRIIETGMSIDFTPKKLLFILCSVDTNVIGNETSSSPSNKTSSASPGYLFGKKNSLLQLVASAGSCLLYFVL